MALFHRCICSDPSLSLFLSFPYTLPHSLLIATSMAFVMFVGDPLSLTEAVFVLLDSELSYPVDPDHLRMEHTPENNGSLLWNLSVAHSPAFSLTLADTWQAYFVQSQCEKAQLLWVHECSGYTACGQWRCRSLLSPWFPALGPFSPSLAMFSER